MKKYILIITTLFLITYGKVKAECQYDCSDADKNLLIERLEFCQEEHWFGWDERVCFEEYKKILCKSNGEQK